MVILTFVQVIFLLEEKTEECEKVKAKDIRSLAYFSDGTNKVNNVSKLDFIFRDIVIISILVGIIFFLKANLSR